MALQLLYKAPSSCPAPGARLAGLTLHQGLTSLGSPAPGSPCIGLASLGSPAPGSPAALLKLAVRDHKCKPALSDRLPELEKLRLGHLVRLHDADELDPKAVEERVQAVHLVVDLVEEDLLLGHLVPGVLGDLLQLLDAVLQAALGQLGELDDGLIVLPLGVEESLAHGYLEGERLLVDGCLEVEAVESIAVELGGILGEGLGLGLLREETLLLLLRLLEGLDPAHHLGLCHHDPCLRRQRHGSEGGRGREAVTRKASLTSESS